MEQPRPVTHRATVAATCRVSRPHRLGHIPAAAARARARALFTGARAHFRPRRARARARAVLDHPCCEDPPLCITRASAPGQESRLALQHGAAAVPGRGARDCAHDAALRGARPRPPPEVVRRCNTARGALRRYTCCSSTFGFSGGHKHGSHATKIGHMTFGWNLPPYPQHSCESRVGNHDARCGSRARERRAREREAGPARRDEKGGRTWQ